MSHSASYYTAPEPAADGAAAVSRALAPAAPPEPTLLEAVLMSAVTPGAPRQLFAAINGARASFVSAYAEGMKNIFQAIVSSNHQDSVFLAGWDSRADRVARLS